jgi:hypothetical protein
MLHAHPRVFSHGEVFFRYQKTFEGRAKRPDPLRYLKRDMLRAGRRHFVFSVHFLRAQHLRPDVVDLGLEDFLDAIPALGVERVALLERRNYLKVLLSSYAGALREQWHVPAYANSTPQVVELDPAATEFARTRLPLITWLEEFERGYAEARRLVAERGGLYLTYEDDVLPDPRIGYGKLCATLGVPAVEVEVPLTRANPFPVREILRNFDAVDRELRATRFAWMLNAD